jgi:histidine triad (HIT) family protein
MHEPNYYDCPFCKLIANRSSKAVDEIIFENEGVVVFPAMHQKQGNKGSLLVAPKEHIENLYALPLELAEPLLAATQRAANALKIALSCDGISIRQHNEPAGGQDVWHYHTHIFPRYINDSFDSSTSTIMPEADRLKLAARLKEAVACR